MADKKTTLATWMRDNPNERGSERWNRAEQALRLLVRPPREPLDMPQYEPSRTATQLDNDYGSIPMRAAMGVAKIPLGLTQMGMKGVDAASTALLGVDPGFSRGLDNSLQAAETMQRRGMDNQGAKYNVAGLVGEMAAPLGMAGKGATLAKTLMGRIGQGMGGGALGGAAVPVNDSSEGFWGKKALMAGLGGVLGGAMPGVAQVGRNIVDPFWKGGGERAASRLLNEAAGDRAPAVVSGLQNSPSLSNDAMVRGSSAGSAPFNAVLHEAGARHASSEVRDMANAANRARQDVVAEIAQTPQALMAAETRRSNATNPLYGASELRQTPVDTTETLRVVNQLLARGSNEDALIGPLSNIKQKLEAGASPQEMISLRRHIKNLMDAKGPTGAKVNDQIVGELTQIKNSLDLAIGDIAPEFTRANELYGQLSTPINQMQVGQELQEKLTPALADFGSSQSLRGTALANALRNSESTLKKATGFGRNRGFESVMTPEQMANINRVTSDMALQGNALGLVKDGATAAQRMIGDVGSERGPGMLERGMMILNNVLKRTGGIRQDITMQTIAELRQNPQEMARVMQLANPIERAEIAQLLRTAPAIAAAEGINAASP